MYTLITDGGNQKDVTYGSYKIFDPSGNLVEHKSFVFGYGTSNLAEYLALIKALNRAVELELNRIIIMTDSELMQKQILGEYQCNYDHLINARDKARRLLKNFGYWKIDKVPKNIIVGQLGH